MHKLVSAFALAVCICMVVLCAQYRNTSSAGVPLGAGSEQDPTDEGLAERAEPGFRPDRPRMAELVSYPLPPRATDGSRQLATRMKAGEFRPSKNFDWLPIGVPPPWDENPTGSGTWDLWRHSFTWTRPLVATWYGDGDRESLELLREIVRDWQAHNAEPPGASRLAWVDQAIANRLQYFCWLWELYRTSGDYEESFGRLLVQLIRQHADDIASGRTYDDDSNHGLIQNSCLLVAAVTVRELDEAEQWRAIAGARTRDYVLSNFSPEGFHLEQSPGYHLAVVIRLANTARFLRVNGQPLEPGFNESIRRVASVWPWLMRPTGTLANVGDTWGGRGRSYEDRCRRWWGDDVPRAAPSTLSNPRDDGAEFMLSFQAGYAIFTSGPVPTSGDDTYVFFKCNAFRYTHYHRDALSLLLSGMGHDWLIDSGVHSHNEDSPPRLYVRSPRAHSLVLVDEQNFRLGKVELVDHGRTAEVDFVTARHQLPQATHTRMLSFAPPARVALRDQLVATDDSPHVYTQVFQIEASLDIKIISDRLVHLVADDGVTCAIQQTGSRGEWRVISGQTEPYWQGWHSPGFEKIEPSPTLYYSTVKPERECDFTTTLQLTRTEPGLAHVERGPVRADAATPAPAP